MPSEVGWEFRSEIEMLGRELAGVSPDLADVPWRAGGWKRRQIVGHLLDSATNNRQRFVRAAIDGFYEGPGYAQDAWVDAHGYETQPWETLLRWWQAEHELLMAVVDRIAEDRLSAQCVVGGYEPVTLRFLIEDYVRHQRHHLYQIKFPAEAQ
jgi:hypothetical protein